MDIFRKIISWFKPIKPAGSESEIEEEPVVKKRHSVYHKCSICGKSLHFVNQFRCHYCNRYHCDKHRLPETHVCKNPTKPKGLHSGRIIYSKGKTIFLRK